MSLPTDYAHTLEAAKRASTLQLLFRAARLLNAEALARANKNSKEFEHFRTSHTLLLPHIDLRGTRLTILAERLGVSKQAVGQLVSELEEFGVLERRPDPEDGRAKLVCFTKKGRRGLLEGLAELQALEGALARAVGSRRVSELHETLTRVLHVVERQALGK
jgi:DNA-binding MarR family transcriptional regulator